MSWEISIIGIEKLGSNYIVLEITQNNTFYQKEFEIQQLIWKIITCIWRYMLGLLL
jgi:hypothetical protein